MSDNRDHALNKDKHNQTCKKCGAYLLHDRHEGFLPCINPNCERDSKMPPLAEQIKNGVVAVAKVAKALYNGDDILVTDKVKAERQTICDGCEFYEAVSKRCSKCGCSTEYKLGLATESCPEGKWEAVEKKKPSFMSVNLKDD